MFFVNFYGRIIFMYRALFIHVFILTVATLLILLLKPPSYELSPLRIGYVLSLLMVDVRESAKTRDS